MVAPCNFTPALATASDAGRRQSDALVTVAILTVAFGGLGRMQLFTRRSRTIVAACTASLFVVALMWTPPQSEMRGQATVIDHIADVLGNLLPCMAPRLTLILPILLLLIFKLSKRSTSRRAVLRGTGANMAGIESDRWKLPDRSGTRGRARANRTARADRAPDNKSPRVAETPGDG